MSDTSQTAGGGPQGVVARIIAAHSRQAVAARDRTDILAAAWERALRHAAVPFKGLDLAPKRTDVQEHADLAPVLDLLPETGLVAVLEDRDGARGLIALSHGTVDALIEVQTTGRVDMRELPARPVTRIDEALCRDFLDLCLAAFAREANGIEDRDWPQRMSFGSRITDRRQLTLLLPERTFHVMSAEVSLGEDAPRSGQAVLVLPRTRDPRPRAVLPDAASVPEAWRSAVEAAMAEARLGLDAVLLRTTRTLREVETLSPGDLIGFEPSDLAAVRLETPSGETVMTGRLGQIAGQRALRMAGESRGALPPADAVPHRTGTEEAGQLDTGAERDPVRGSGDATAPDISGEMAPPAAPGPSLQDAMAQPIPEPDVALPEVAPTPAPLDFTPQTAPLDPSAFPE